MDPITRRRFIRGAAALGLLARGPHATASEPAPTFEGCFLRVAPERNFLELYNWSVTSGDQEADDVCRTAAGDLRRVLRVAPDYWFFDDRGTANAFATPLRRKGSVSAVGTVALGTRLVYTVSRRNELNRGWRVRLTAIVAHEWAHIAQFARQYRTATVKSRELHADYMAGWFLGRTTPKDRAEAVRNEAMYRFYFLGDTETAHPDHHGTHIERASAITKGFEAAAKVDDLDAAFAAERF